MWETEVSHTNRRIQFYQVKSKPKTCWCQDVTVSLLHYKFDNKASLEQTSQNSQKMWKNARRVGNICLGCGKRSKLMHDILIDINIQKKIGIKKCTQLKNVENFQGAIFWVSNNPSEVLPTIIISFDITSLTWNRLIFDRICVGLIFDGAILTRSTRWHPRLAWSHHEYLGWLESRQMTKP